MQEGRSRFAFAGLVQVSHTGEVKANPFLISAYVYLVVSLWHLWEKEPAVELMCFLNTRCYVSYANPPPPAFNKSHYYLTEFLCKGFNIICTPALLQTLPKFCLLACPPSRLQHLHKAGYLILWLFFELNSLSVVLLKAFMARINWLL
uniref:Uncharacterized protein n=1 Tax=Sphaerodactylus townsendi TaxID=933632 RepID=A0ACB8GA94_9SAUR